MTPREAFNYLTNASKTLADEIRLLNGVWLSSGGSDRKQIERLTKRTLGTYAELSTILLIQIEEQDVPF